MWSVSVDNDIKNNDFKQAYLFYGSESYLKNQYKDKLVKAINAGEMNTTCYFGKGVNIGALIDLAETLPFLSEKRLIILEESECVKTSCPELAEYIPKLPESTILILIESAVDKRNAVYQAIKKLGGLVEFEIPEEEDVKIWLRSRLKKEGKSIANSALNVFLEREGGDMMRLSSELEKLICYIGDRDEITIDDVKALCTKQTEIKIFDMVRHVSSGNQKAALDIYYELLAAKEAPMRILFNLGKQFNQLFMVKNLEGDGLSSRQMADKLGLKEGVVKSLLSQSRRFKSSELMSIVRECVELEEAVKTGKLDDNMSVELFIIKYVNK